MDRNVSQTSNSSQKRIFKLNCQKINFETKKLSFRKINHNFKKDYIKISLQKMTKSILANEPLQKKY